MSSMLNEENIFSISIAAVNIIGIGPYIHIRMVKRNIDVVNCASSGMIKITFLI